MAKRLLSIESVPPTTSAEARTSTLVRAAVTVSVLRLNTEPTSPLLLTTKTVQLWLLRN